VESKASSTQPVDVKLIDVEESKNWFTEMKNSKVTKINSKGSNGVAAPQVATKIDKWSVLTKKYDCSLVKKESKGPEERTANKSDKNTGVAYIDLETENRCSSPLSMNISHDDFEPTVVAETPNYNEPLTVKKEPINEAYSTTVDVKPIDVEESKSCFTEMKNSKVTKINSKGSNGVAASQVATRMQFRPKSMTAPSSKQNLKVWKKGQPTRTTKLLVQLILIWRPKTEHPSDTKVLTMKMEILLEPTSNKLLWIFNSLVHSLRALSTLRRSGLRTASAAAKPCQGDSSEVYLITGRIPDDLQHSFRNSDACYHVPERCEHAGPKVTTSHGGNTSQQG
ncbi:hypothetical protein Tco_1022637, partial [Tanacetum coccineum]